MHIAHSMTEEAIRRALGQVRFLRDREPSFRLGSDESLCVAAYVDNYIVLGVKSNAVQDAADKINQQLNRQGLPTHEVQTAQAGGEFIGMEFSGFPARVRVKPARLWRLWAGIGQALRLKCISPKLMETLVGHLTWAMLVNRPALSLLDACYAVSHSSGPVSEVLSQAARRELRLARDLLPLFVGRMHGEWQPLTVASDASPVGLGACHRRAPKEIISGLGRTCEAWR